MNRTQIVKLIGLTLVAVLSSCASVEDSEEYKALEATVSEIESSVSKLEVDVSSRRSDATRLADLKQQREDLRNQVNSLMMDVDLRRRIVSEIGIDACARYQSGLQEAAGLVDLDYQSNKAFWGKVEELVAPEDQILGDTTVRDDDLPGLKAYNTDLAATGCERRAVDDFYDKCETFDKRVMNKNPESYKGKCVRGTVRIAQFDTNTGPCAFQGYLGGGYDVRAQFGETLNPETHATVKECEWTSKLVEDNFITFWGWGLGAFTYDTANGGKQTVPAFKLVMYRRG